MGQIRFKWYYTDFVEHCLRKAVRYDYPSEDMPKDWFSFAKTWIDFLSDEDKKFILFVFDKQFFNATEGLYCFDEETDLYSKRERLAILEKQFAIAGGLFNEVSDSATDTEKHE